MPPGHGRLANRSVDALICNAAIMGGRHQVTAQGYERQMGTNHLGHAALVARLFPLLEKASGRIVMVSSIAARGGSLGPHMTVDDLIALQEEVAQAHRNGQEPGWETSAFASIRVFKGKPDSAHRAHTAMTRMTAMGRLIEEGTLAIWMEKSNEPDVELVPRNVLQAAARCPLIRVGDAPGFDLATFRRFALELATSN